MRIGVNLGDVIIEEEDRHGDGVNIAARLQQLAEPGGIAVSRTVVDNVRNKLPIHLESLGEQAYPSLVDVPGKIAIVNVFRRPEFVDEIVDQVIQLKIPAIWMQEEVINEFAAARARKAGIFVAMDLCILKEHKARFG